MPKRSHNLTPSDDFVAVVERWFNAEMVEGRSNIGLANGGLRLIEIFRSHFPLRPSHYASRKGTQVAGLSGRSGDGVIARFLPNMRPLGTESGRTSRGVLPAVGRLADSLNALTADVSAGQKARGLVADRMQLWLIENPIRAYFAADKLQPNVNPRHTSGSNIRSVLEAARARSQSGQVAQHLVGAKLAMRFPDQEVSNHSYSTADVPTGRPGDFVLGSTVFHVTVAAISASLMRKCRQNLRNNYRVVLLVPDGNREGARQWASSENLGDTVEVAGLETFIGQNVDEMAGFNQGQFENRLRQLLEIYNQRVRDAEPDPSLEIEIPANMSRRRGRS